MRVGIVSEWFSRGAGYVGRQYELGLRNEECEVFIYARGDQHVFRGDEWSGENVYQGRPCRIGIPKAIFAPDYITWLKRVRPDVVLFNEQHWLPPVLWTRKMGIKTAAYVDYYTKDSVPTFGWYDILLCNTQRHFSVFGWHPGCRFVRWGTDIRSFRPSQRPDRPVTFVHSAGWDPQRKGTEQVLRSWLKLEQGSHLVVHSQADISRFLTADGVAEAIASGSLTVLSGTIAPHEIYRKGDVYVYPTHLEGIGLSIVEALASGLPVIVPDDGPMNEFCLDQQSKRVPIAEKFWRADNYYWPCNNVTDDDLTAAMAGFVKAPTSTINEWRSSCRTVAEENFDWWQNSKGLRKILEDLPVHEVYSNVARQMSQPRAGAAYLVSLIGGLVAATVGARKVSTP